ncbi:MAG: hypothetical protein RL621_556 [Bacteroidota bacterium]|jgi:hypothetical protein
MAYLEDHKAKFENLKVSLNMQNRDQLRRKANGGNSIIFTYPPVEESLYIQKFEELNSEQTYSFVDIAKLLVEFIDMDGWTDFENYYNDFKDTPHLIFKSEDESTDLMDLIISAINDADQKGKIPVLIRTGSLYGTGIENVNIMEHKTVMGLNNPLVILYPSKIENENLYFLNFKLASKYRCTVIE